eukprot:TRINITY_DN6873_c0_g2_i1.p1 TRINITY_DN6873_c0_g2~~TRINITY_DN6873_c0_g2_i1.p1  ORF type:complete len:483 (+),score=94.07 TRINITY_DN6873_c0_g2_i1:200-1648(+)
MASLEHNAVAVALQLAAIKMSPQLAKDLQTHHWQSMASAALADDEKLVAAPPPPKPSRGSFTRPPPKPVPREVPASVVAAAAAVAQAIAATSAGPQAAQVSPPAPGASVISPSRGSRLDTATSGRPPSRDSDRGASVWVTQPGGVMAESRLCVELPEAEFTYIERPWSHFLNRWAAIDFEMRKTFMKLSGFTIIDVGSCCGFFSLQAAAGYSHAVVVGVEGSVGVGNGTMGVGGTQDEIIETKAIQTHLKWVQKLDLRNCAVAPDVWDYQRVCALAAQGRYICHAMLLLSVVHHIDNISVDQYAAAGLDRVQGTVSLMANLLQLAPRHFVELPARPWLDHVYIAFVTARAFLDAAAQATGRRWKFIGPLTISEWYGRRELWLIEQEGEEAFAEPLPRTALQAIFRRMLPRPPAAAVRPADFTSDQDRQRAPPQPAHPPAHLVQAEIGAGLLQAPTALIAAHLQLRDALASAETLLQEELPAS